jgi:hypothetical protein
MLTEPQLTIISLIVAAILWVLKMWRAAGGQEISDTVLKWILFVFAGVLAFIFAVPVIPVFPAMVGDPAVITNAVIVWLGAVVSMAATLLGFATAIFLVLTQGIIGKQIKNKIFASTPAYKGNRK